MLQFANLSCAAEADGKENVDRMMDEKLIDHQSDYNSCCRRHEPLYEIGCQIIRSGGACCQ